MRYFAYIMCFFLSQPALADTFMTGHLVFVSVNGEHNTIKELDLTSLKVQVILAAGDGTRPPFETFETLTKIDENSFLFSESSESNDGRSINSIKRFDRQTGKVSFLTEGYYPTYIPEHRKLFFFRSNADTGTQLFLDDGIETKPIMKNAEDFLAGPITQISPDEVAFLVNDAIDAPVYVYNMIEGKIRKLSFKEFCRPELWRKASRQLLCSDRKGNYYLTDLEGASIQRLPFGIGEAAVLYVPDGDFLIYSKSRLTWHLDEAHDIWAYSFQAGRSIRIFKDASVGILQAAWFK